LVKGNLFRAYQPILLKNSTFQGMLSGISVKIERRMQSDDNSSHGPLVRVS